MTVETLAHGAAVNLPLEVFDGPKDECGWVVVNSPTELAGQIACRAICVLDNRGYQATGVAVTCQTAGGEPYIKVDKGFGKGKIVFPDQGATLYPSHQGAAHARYSTQGTNELSGAQPHGFEVQTKQGIFHFVHVVNGNLKNTEKLAVSLGKKTGEYASDSEVAGMAFADTMQWMANNEPETPLSLEDVVLRTIPKFHGSFMGAVMMKGQTVVYCDPYGLKPGVIGTLPDGGIIAASEVTALDVNNAVVLREIEPGEIIVINEEGSDWHSVRWTAPRAAGCLLELLYTMRTVGKIDGQPGTKATFHGLEVATARKNAGRSLAGVAPVAADYVFGVPNSAVLAGEGYSEASGTPYQQLLMARSLDKSFIAPTQAQRTAMVREKLYVPDMQRNNITGKNLVVVEDSLVRGTTAKEFVSLLRDYEPAAIHLRIAMDRISCLCELGMDIGNLDDLIAVNMSDQEICDYLGVDTIAFLPVEKINADVLGDKADGFCKGCITGHYPTDELFKAGDPLTITRKPALV